MPASPASDAAAHRAGLDVGQPMPDFILPDHREQPVHFTEARRGRRALVHFFRSTVW